jgi:voltage-gated potassium channel
MSGVVNRKRLYEIIFESDTRAGRNFDVVLLVAIVLSMFVVMAESVQEYKLRYGYWLNVAEWFFTLLFTLEYLLRLYTVPKPVAYATSRFGIIDLLAILPNYLSLLFPGMQYLLVIRVLRLLRVFRIFKMGHFLSEGNTIVTALYMSRRKIIVFLLFILLMVTVIGAVLYVVEAPYNENFASIPVSIYWAIVTLTTVGYGDISPVTDFGRMLAALVMLLGYAVLAVPTGIVSAEMLAARKDQLPVSSQTCPHCMREGHDVDARFCKYCGGEIN